MPLRPCLDCGTLSTKSRCEAHRLQQGRAKEAARSRPGPRQRGLDAEYETNRAIVLANSRLCWLCRHDGADQADHVIPRHLGGTSAVANLRPAHGTQPCVVCGRRCNQVRGTQPQHGG